MSQSLIASSAHLAAGRAPDLSEVEFGLMIAKHAFDRWTVRAMAAAGLADLAATDVMVLHHVHHRQRGKKLADICFTLNVEDTHIVSYALKKLERLGVVRHQRQGKEAFYSTTGEGDAVIARYQAIREQCLLDGLASAASTSSEVNRQLAQTLRPGRTNQTRPAKSGPVAG